ncbi:heparan sulfate glucosamine 3-O-sulfotransferase 1-like [Huso huso]|uniref:Sulfotransferase n=1 Tax=Huso huso TaxID=61971 RepID=A0ABR0Y9N3_HUSHU
MVGTLLLLSLLFLSLLLLLQAQLSSCLQGGGGGPTQRLPGAIIIGVRKGGTRALLEMLNVHPDIRAAKSEVHFFNRDQNYQRGPSWYRAQMPESLPGQLTVEKTPGYFSSQVAPERARALNASLRLLLIVRDPVERLVSDYTQVLSNRRERGKGYPPLERLLIREGRVDPSYKAVQRSVYHLQLAAWLRCFPPGQIHVVDGDALIRDPFPELRRVEGFLSLAPAIAPSDFRFNHTKGFFCLESGGRHRCLDESKGRPHPPVRPAVRQRLCRHFREHNRRFFEMVGRSFDWC